jgi:hypothetical protein
MIEIAQWRAERQVMSRAPDLFDSTYQTQVVSDLPVRAAKNQALTVPVSANLLVNMSGTKLEAPND